jgi:predicted ferric reductase
VIIVLGGVAFILAGLHRFIGVNKDRYFCPTISFVGHVAMIAWGIWLIVYACSLYFGFTLPWYWPGFP